jgi:mannose-6-phosphate isomerase-like protein (cupin superfamily)
MSTPRVELSRMQIVHDDDPEVLDVLGPMLEFLRPPSEAAGDYCVLKGTLPPGMTVPLHSHPDDESMYVLCGVVQVLSPIRNSLEWRDAKIGDFVHIPRGVRHAWRNSGSEPVLQIITTTVRLGRFFQEIGRPIARGEAALPPTAAELKRFSQAAVRYGHWLGSPAENAAFGIELPA